MTEEVFVEKLETPESSQVECSLYFFDKGWLQVHFRSGAIYQYECTREEWEKFKEAPSKGAFILKLQNYTQIRGRLS